MATERFLVTGALGCIGAWTVRQLIRDGSEVWTYDLPGEPHRLRLIMSEEELEQVHRVSGDITDAEAFERAVLDNRITHICHLAAMQVPLVRANPVLGARVNVVGTTIVFETIKRHAGQIQGLAYCSSVAVYGHPDNYPPGSLAHDAPLAPENLYGVFKQANEGAAAIYWLENQVPSIGLRPCVVYGPGRDQGWTSLPTKAMLAAAAGRPFHMSFGGSLHYHHAADAAAAIVRAARTRVEGAPVFNLGGTTASMADIVAAIETAEPKAAGQITFDDVQIAAPPAVDGSELDKTIGTCAWRCIEDGVRETIEVFRAAIKAGNIDVDRILT